MATVAIDLTKPFVVPPGTYTGTCTKADIVTPIPGDLNAKGNQKQPYINWAFLCPEIPEGEIRTVYNITSFASPKQIKVIVEALGVAFDASGFITEDCIGKQVTLEVGVVEDPTRGPQNIITKFTKI